MNRIKYTLLLTVFSCLFIASISNPVFSQSAADLHNEVKNIINSDPEKALKLAEKQIKLAKPNTIDYINGLNDLGNVYYYFDDYPAGLKTLDESIKQSDAINYPLGKAEASVIMGNILILEGKFSDALVHFSEGLAIFETLKDNNGIAQCNNGLGNHQPQSRSL